MTHRERVLCALQHEEPDKLPIDLGAMRSTGISAVAYNRLRKYLGLEVKNTRVFDPGQMLAEPEPDILERFGVDVVLLKGYIRGWRPGKLPDGSPCFYPEEFKFVEREDGTWEALDGDRIVGRMPAGGYWFDGVYHPLADAQTPDDIDAYDFPTLSDEAVAYLERESKRLYEETDYAILGEFGGNLLEGGHGDFGYERFMELLLTDPDLVEYYLDRKLEAYMASLERYVQAVGDRVQIIQFGDDLGTQDGPAISPALYRRVFKPRHARMFQFVHEHTSAYVFFHSCGSVYAFIPDLIEIGVDILNPVQISAKDMEPERLKREFGQHLTFWGGGCDTQWVLPRAPLDELRRHVANNIEVFRKGGGYVFNQVHNILQDVSPERIVAMFDTALALR